MDERIEDDDMPRILEMTSLCEMVRAEDLYPDRVITLNQREVEWLWLHSHCLSGIRKDKDLVRVSPNFDMNLNRMMAKLFLEQMNFKRGMLQRIGSPWTWIVTRIMYGLFPYEKWLNQVDRFQGYYLFDVCSYDLDAITYACKKWPAGILTQGLNAKAAIRDVNGPPFVCGCDDPSCNAGLQEVVDQSINPDETVSRLLKDIDI